MSIKTITQWRIFQTDILLSALSGLLLGVGFYYPFFWPIVFVGLIPFLYVQGAHQTLKERAVSGFVLGMCLYGCALFSIHWHTLPIDWFGIASPILQVGAVGFSWVVASAILALGTTAFSLLLPYASKTAWSILFIPVLWVLGESFGSLMTSLILVGEGSLIGAHFTLGYVGYLLAYQPALLQLAAIGGIFLLSAVAIAMNVVVYRLIYVSSRKEHYVLVGALCFLYVGVVVVDSLLAPVRQIEGDTVHIAALSTYQPPHLYYTIEEERERVEDIATLVEEAGKVDVILLPESASFARYASEKMEQEATLMVDTENRMDTEGKTRAEMLFWYQDGHSEKSTKQYILPLGEYIPYIYRAALMLVPDETFRKQVLGTRSFVSGEDTHFASVPGGKLAVRFCDEVMSPYLYSRDIQSGADILSNVSSYSWFHGSRQVFDHMQAIAKVRAVETGRWYVQSGNMSPAYILNHHGQVVSQTPWGQYALASEDIPLRTLETPYQVIKPYIFFLHTFLLIGMIILYQRRKVTS